MKLTSKGRYAVQALAHLAKNSENKKEVTIYVRAQIYFGPNMFKPKYIFRPKYI